MTNIEPIKALKYINRKKSAPRHKINKHINRKGGDVLDNQLFYSHTQTVSDPMFNEGYYVPQPDDIFELSIQGHNLLAEYTKETKAVKRANLSLLLSLFAVLIAAVALAYNIFTP